MMSDLGKAVFLSYASQDSEAAKRICEALRAGGVEVWFDQSELVGGDAWDAKIRGQIASCSLFVPIISANTQARLEGYFRREWKQAANRTHDMADEKAFLLPVVIDDTRDAEAKVPPEFKAVQWTRMPGGETSPAFCARVERLLGGEITRPEVGSRPPLLRKETGHPRSTALSRWPWLLGGTAALAIGFTAWILSRSPDSPRTSASNRAAETKVAASATKTPARQLADKALVVALTGSATIEQLRAAAGIAEKAAKEDPLDGEIWAIGALVDLSLYELSIDVSEKRRDALRLKLSQAKGLAPRAPLARYAEAKTLLRVEPAPAGLKAAEEILRGMLDATPPELTRKNVISLLVPVLAAQHRFAEAARLAEDSELWSGAFWSYLEAGDLPKAASVAERQTKDDQVDGLYLQMVVQFARGDLDAWTELLNRLPATALLEERILSQQLWLAYYRRDAAGLLAAARRFPTAYLETNAVKAPKGTFIGIAHQWAGQTEAARSAWGEALQEVDRRLAIDPKVGHLRMSRIWLLAYLDRKDEARQALADFRLQNQDLWMDADVNGLLTHLDQKEEALNQLEQLLHAQPRNYWHLHTAARYAEDYDPLRGNPRFEKLLRETLLPGAKPLDDDKPTATTTAEEKSLVVLPLENLSPDPENAFFTDGMHSEIISVLSRTTDLKVISRATALALKGTNLSLSQVAQKLGVANVIVGNVRRAGDRVRVELELRRASDEAVLWQSPKVERKLIDIFALQSEIAEEVARALKARASRTQADQGRYSTRSPEAYDLFLKANQVFFMYKPTAFEEAIALGTASLQLDPNYAMSAFLVTAAHCNIVDHSRDPALRTKHAAEAKQWAEKSAALDPAAGAKATSIYCLTVTRDYPQALEMAEKALLILPHDEAALTFRGWALVRLGRAAEALESFRRAREQDPLNRFTVGNELDLLVILRRRVEVEAAIARLPIMTSPDPGAGDFYRRITREARYRINGDISTGIDELAGLEKLESLWLRRKFSDLSDATALTTPVANQDRVEWIRTQLLRHDSLQREQRAIEAAAVARELLAEIQNWQAEKELDPSVRSAMLAEALARTGDVRAAMEAMLAYVSAPPETSVEDLWVRKVTQARLFAYLRQNQASVTLLSKLLSVPSRLTVAMLKVDPCWDNLRGDSAFEALLADPANSAPF